jgi:hypothetical protein
MALAFRNLTVTPADPVDRWGVEGILAAIERGGAEDWGKVLHALDDDTTGQVEACVLEAAACADLNQAVAHLLASYARGRRPQELTASESMAARTSGSRAMASPGIEA